MGTTVFLKASESLYFLVFFTVYISCFIILGRELFDKPSDYIKWSEELFKIHSINKSNVITYKITDMNNEIIQRIFYETELQLSKMKEDGLYIIEKIIYRYLIKWRNYSNEFNSWINKNDIVKYV